MKRSKISTYSTRLAAAYTAGLLMAPTASNAAGFSAITGNIVASTSDSPNLIMTVAYISGLAFAVAGVLKLKAHVDAPQQVPLKDGLIRLGAGGGLLALPAVLQAMSETIGTAGTGADISDLSGAITNVTF